MIFLTVGTQLHFDRLIMVADDWLGENPDQAAFAQVGQTSRSFKNLKYKNRLTPAEVGEMYRKSNCVVSHAGMGSVLMALKFRKPLIIMPRRAELNEHRNNHQLATARWLEGRPGIRVAWDEIELAGCLDARVELAIGDEISDYAEPQMLDKLREFIVRG